MRTLSPSMLASMWIQPPSFIFLAIVYSLISTIVFIVLVAYVRPTWPAYDCLVAGLAWPVVLAIAARRHNHDA